MVLLLAMILAWDYPTVLPPNQEFHVKWGIKSGVHPYHASTLSKTMDIVLPTGTYYFVVTVYDTGSKQESTATNEIKYAY
jgi:hypothetical protein